jgi:hypothetical protein
MFRKMAIALVAASVFTAPVLAQDNTLSGGKNQPATSTPSGTIDKTEKSTESVEKGGKSMKHHRTARHHRTKAAKYGKAHGTTAGKLHGAKAEKLAHRTGHGRMMKHEFGKASKHTPSTSGSAH